MTSSMTAESASVIAAQLSPDEHVSTEQCPLKPALNERRALTGRQQAVLDIIRRSIQTRGFPPTLREIGAAMNIRSTNGVNDHLRALERKGYIEPRDEMTARAIRPVDGPRVGVALARPRFVSPLEARLERLEAEVAELRAERGAA